MKKAQLIGIGIALGAGALAFFVAKSFMRPPPVKVVQAEKMDTVQVLIARADIGLGQVTNTSSFRWQDWPREAVSQHFITKSAKPNAERDYSGQIARTSISSGEPITPVKLIKAGAGGVLAAILSPGMRAVAIKIANHTAVGKLILPNDHVDVLLSTRQRARGGGGGGEDVSTEVLLRNVRVLAVGQQIEAKEGKKNSEGDVASLEVSPGQAEVIAQSSMRGEISLALRSVADIGTAGANEDSRPRTAAMRSACSATASAPRLTVSTETRGSD